METIREIISSLSGETLVNLVLLIPLACLSLVLFLGYKSICASYKEPKYAKMSYRKILWIRIFVKSTIFVPFISWLLDVIAFKSSLLTGFGISWIVWCATIWCWRKIYKKSERTPLLKRRHRFITENNGIECI